MGSCVGMVMGIRWTDSATEDGRTFRCAMAVGGGIETRLSGMINADDDDDDVLERTNVARRVGRRWRTMVK